MSGIKYGDTERTRVYLALAINEFQGKRDRVISQTSSLVVEHQSKRPVEPQPYESRRFSLRERGLLLCCAAAVLWPVLPALTRSSDPLARPSWGWPIAAAIVAAFGIKDLIKSRTHDALGFAERPRRSLARRGLTASAVAAALVIGGGFAVPASALEGTVQRVVDGDTVVVRVNNSDLRIRILNIDTPETVDPDQADECLGQEASAYTEQLLPPGTRVDLKFDKERTDRYGRTLAVVTRSDGKSVAVELAKAGLGVPLVVGGNDTYFAPVLAAFKQAEADERGYFDSGIECTFPARQVQLQEAVAAAQAAESGVTAAEAIAAAASVYALYKVHNATVHLIRTGTSFPIRAMKVVGATAAFTAYRATTTSLGRTYRKLDAIATERQKAEDEAEAQRKEAEAAAQRAAEEQAGRQREEQARRQREEQSSSDDNDDSGSSSGSGSNTGDSGYPCPGASRSKDRDGDGWCGES